MPKITKTLIDSLKPTGQEQFVWDTELRGFAVRIMKSGRMSYALQYKTAQGATRRMVIGQIGALTPDEARKLAKARLAEVEAGRDPSAERNEKREALTVAELCAIYMSAAKKGAVTTRFRKAKRPSTIINDEGRINRHVVPLIGSLPASELKRADVQRMADAISEGKTAGRFKTGPRGKAVVEGGPSTAARTVELLGGVWTWAERRGHVSGSNPARGVEKHRPDARNRVLAHDELTRLGAALQDHAERYPLACAAIRLIALT